MGYDKNLINLNSNLVLPAYQNHVKKDFIKAFKLFGIWKEATIENQLEEKLHQLADSIT